MSKVNFGKTVSLKQAANLILRTPTVRYFLQGEPGIGKSSLLGYLSEHLPSHNVAYIDCPNMDLGDIAMPVVDHERKITRYYPNSRFRLHEKKSVIIMLDEFTKAPDAVKNMLHPLLEVHNPRLGDIPIAEDSIVFLTGNLGSDGVGDSLKAHSRNRVVPLTVRKPNAEEWLEWAVGHEIEPVVLACVRQFPQFLSSYTDEHEQDNPYIYNPRKFQTAFVSPRSLERASQIIAQREHFDTDSVICALSGAIGEAAARDMQAFIDYQDQLPSWDEVMRNPKKTKVPDSAGACAVMVYGAITKIDKDSFPLFMTYLDRFAPEWQACFAINVARSAKQTIAVQSPAFKDWLLKNQDLL